MRLYRILLSFVLLFIYIHAKIVLIANLFHCFNGKVGPHANPRVSSALISVCFVFETCGKESCTTGTYVVWNCDLAKNVFPRHLVSVNIYPSSSTLRFINLMNIFSCRRRRAANEVQVQIHMCQGRMIFGDQVNLQQTS